MVPVPGPSAVAAALSAAGVPADRFLFDGFLPVKPGRRVHRLEALRDLDLTVVCYESPHRILASLEAIAQVFGEREIVVARELTKQFEEIVRGSAAGARALTGPARGRVHPGDPGCVGAAGEPPRILRRCRRWATQGPDHRRLRLRRRRGHPGGSQDVLRLPGVRHVRDHRGDGAELPRRPGRGEPAARVRGAAARRRSSGTSAPTRPSAGCSRPRRSSRRSPSRLATHRIEKLVVDPVMVAKSGDPLLQPDARAALADRILPLALVVTPEPPRGRSAGRHPGGRPRRHGGGGAAHPPAAARATCWSRAGHLKGDATDLLWNGREFTRFPAPGSTPEHPRHRLHLLGGHRGRARARASPGDAIRAAKAYVTAADPRGLPGRPRGGPAPSLRERAGERMAEAADDKMSFFDHLTELRTRIVEPHPLRSGS